MIGMADIARMMLGDDSRLIAPVVKGDFVRPHFRAGLALNANPFKVWRALNLARRELRQPSTPPVLEPGRKHVAVIGHFYNIDDEYVSQEVVSAFETRGYRVLRKDQLPERLLNSGDGFASSIRWAYERELYNAFRYYADKVEGVCVLVSMGCGPDSLVAEFMREECNESGVPYIQLVLDEHTGTAGLVTRVEAFVDLAERRRREPVAA